MESVTINIDSKEFIAKNVGTAALYEQLAEEAAELAQAALKVSRILRGDNPTPIEPLKAAEDVIKEYTDVYLVSNILDIDIDATCFVQKRQRWVKRIINQD